MCGVLAIASDQPLTIDDRSLSRALERLASRGPDAQGRWTNKAGTVTLAHTRLAIVDLSAAGAQPMHDPRRGLTLVYNGEIYNAPDLRRRLEREGERFEGSSDTEVLLKALGAWGIERTLDALRGMFAFVLWNERERTLDAAVDHAGMKPLAWSFIGGVLRLASDCDALRAVLPERPSPDPHSLCLLLTTGSIPWPRTVWEGVCKLGPGQRLCWSPGREPKVEHWWSPPTEIDRSIEDADAWFESEWPGVLAEHTLGDVPIGLFLSGGIDSACVAAGLAEAGHRLTCLTLALDGKDDESAAAAETARALGLSHEVVPFAAPDVDAVLARASEAYDEPQAFGAILTATAIARAARERGKVFIVGDGGDEAFAGYRWHEYEFGPGPSPREVAIHGQRVASPDASGIARECALVAFAFTSPAIGYMQAVFPRFHPAEAATIFEPTGVSFTVREYAAQANGAYTPELPRPRRWQRHDILNFCASSILPKIDRASMGVGLELRAPFLDRRILDRALALPLGPDESDYGCPPVVSKGVLRRWIRPRLGDAILSRPKQGFSLRLGDRDIWRKRLGMVEESPLGRSGVLHDRWRNFVAPDAPFAESRAQAMCFLAAWSHGRL
ncbi:MAG: asparagine synthase (glutamine-hydrolyzing) [Phycisphaerales bacterium]|nr:asparagine synthase (glutamine-hydrolyzing) [Phycisphaerales bacterium]